MAHTPRELIIQHYNPEALLMVAMPFADPFSSRDEYSLLFPLLLHHSLLVRGTFSQDKLFIIIQAVDVLCPAYRRLCESLTTSSELFPSVVRDYRREKRAAFLLVAIRGRNYNNNYYFRTYYYHYCCLVSKTSKEALNAHNSSSLTLTTE